MKRIVLFAFAAALLLAALWFGMRPPATPAASLPSSAGALQRPDAAQAEAPRHFALQLPVADAVTPVLQVRAGETVELEVTSPRDDELHLHGYDLSLQLKAGVPGTLRFTAEHAGRFDVELHHAHAELAVLEVQPR
jgi:hypothetical protein